MKRRKTVRVLMIVILAVIVLSTLAIALLGIGRPKDIDGASKYSCDVKNFRFATTIEVKKDGDEFGTISGNIFTFVVDPLTLTNSAGNKVAYAGDEYHFIAQDSHSIYLNDSLEVEMVGNFSLWGDNYEIYNNNQQKIAKVSFNGLNTGGEMYDTNGKRIAIYSSNYFFNDYEVQIAKDCEMDENVVLMIFASYYSDQAADSRAASSNSSSNHKTNN